MTELAPVKVRIRNYQSLEDVTLEVRGFTCISGPSNIGKSAIIRAISGALLNAPAINEVREGRKFCTVELDGGHWSIKWEKSKTVSRSWIPADADKPLTAVGRGQLDEVAEFGFRSVELGRGRVQPWFASQFEPLFLLKESGPAITDFISEVSRLSVLQDGIVINSRAKRRALERAKVRDEDADKLRAKLGKVGRLDLLVKVRKDLGEQMRSIREWDSKVRRALELQEEMRRTEESIATLEPYREIRTPADLVARKLEHVRTALGHWRALEDAAWEVRKVIGAAKVRIPEDEAGPALERAKSLRRFLSVPSLIRSVESLSGVEKLEVPGGPEPDEVASAVRGAALAREVGALQESIRALEADVSVPEAPEWDLGLERAIGIASAMAEANREKTELEERLASLRSELAEVESELAEIPTCPTCERPVGAQHARHAESA